MAMAESSGAVVSLSTASIMYSSIVPLTNGTTGIIAEASMYDEKVIPFSILPFSALVTVTGVSGGVYVALVLDEKNTLRPYSDAATMIKNMMYFKKSLI